MTGKTMNIHEIITKKRDGLELLPAEIDFVIQGHTRGAIPDYQMSALLMAMFINGLDNKETSALARSMTLSGKVLDLSSVRFSKIDKHSTGGVGDGTSLVIAPLCACCGIAVPMMSGRSLGHTGGTLDKLESIPGFNVNLDEARYKKLLKDIGVAMIGQTSEAAPADRKLYAIRDVTATVDSIPLIAASIMSKKIAEGSEGIVLDVKTGNGAFMRDIKSARELAKMMLKIGKANGLKMRALITDMNQPLGLAVGNALEVKQAINVMRGGGPEDFVELCLELSARMLVLGEIEKTVPCAKKLLKESLLSGKALEKFRRIIELQGGDARVVDNPGRYLPESGQKEDIYSEKNGFVSSFDTKAIGLAAVNLGAGRITKEDRIDHSAGFILHKKIGDRVSKGEPLAAMFYNTGRDANEMHRMFKNAVDITASKSRIPRLIYEEL